MIIPQGGSEVRPSDVAAVAVLQAAVGGAAEEWGGVGHAEVKAEDIKIRTRRLTLK